MMDGIELDSSAFDEISLHDVRVYALAFQRREQQGNLILDIDYLAQWNSPPEGGHDFLIVPATMTFVEVVDLEVHLDWGPSVYQREPYGVICCPSGELIINDWRRFAYTDPVYTGRSRPFLRYELDFWEPRGGRVCLGAQDFRIVGRQDGVHSHQQTLDPAQRTPLLSSG
jgi:hypothetical protein